MQELKEIILTEIKRLHAEMLESALDLIQLKRLESVTRAWKNLSDTPLPTGEISLEGLSSEELLSLANSDTHEVKSIKHPSREADPT